MTPDLPTRVREAFKASEVVEAVARGLAAARDIWDELDELTRDEYRDDARLALAAIPDAALAAVVQEDRTREIDNLRALLRELTAHETEPCSLDHHGNCQEHGWFMDNGDKPGDCVIVRARAALGGTTDA